MGICMHSILLSISRFLGLAELTNLTRIIIIVARNLSHDMKARMHVSFWEQSLVGYNFDM